MEGCVPTSTMNEYRSISYMDYPIKSGNDIKKKSLAISHQSSYDVIAGSNN